MPPAVTSAIVTGHSRGLGAAIANHLVSRGTRVLGVARHPNRELARRRGADVTEVALDLADTAVLARWLETNTLERFLRGSKTALLVNNAGVLHPLGPLESQSTAEIARAVSVNVAAVFMLSAAFAQITRECDDRRILHISSGAATNVYQGWAVYSATKAALDQHARAVALDRSPGLRIAAVAPGVIDTDMQTEIRSTTDDKFPQRQRFVALKRDGQLHDPDESGQTIADFLLSDTFGREPVVDLRSYYVNQ
jgi:NAD(P)-dependent dehydrogenase (short-subunit alcohol dehydrogenase family)